MQEKETHYLKAELDELFRTDSAIWAFVQQGSLDGVWYWDLEHPEQEWMSPEMWRLFGIDPSTKRHDPAEWQDMIFEDDLAVALENFQKHCDDPSHPYDQTVRYRHVDGSTVWVRCRGIAIRDAAGNPIRMLGAHNDLTATKQAELDARTSVEAAELANAELRDFSYSMSHDLKAPANTIKMLLEEIIDADEGNLNEEQKLLMGAAEQTTRHMLEVVSNVLMYTGLMDETYIMEQCSLAEVASDVTQALQESIIKSGTELHVEPLPGIVGNRGQLTSLFKNLIENSMKYGAEGRRPKIRISCENLDPKTIQLTFTDNGIGIAPQHQSRVFDIFKRLHPNTEVKGTGLGLTMCRRVVANHGGEISLQSELGNGTSFIVRLPRDHRRDRKGFVDVPT
ncbi:MAG: ATP-binding protein [Sulfitobacter sp.]